MNYSIKRALALILTLALALPLAACGKATDASPADATAAPAAEADRDAVAATVGNYEIRLGDFTDTFNSIIQSYQYFGQAAPTDEAGIAEVQDTAMEELVSSKMMYYQGEKLGLYPLTEEQTAAVAEETQSNVDELMTSFRAYAEEEGAADVDARAQEMIDEALASNGWSLDFEGYKGWLSEYNTTLKITELVKAEIENGVTLTEDDYKAYYDELVSTQTEKYATAAAEYLNDSENYEMYGGEPVLVIPDGFVRIKVISLSPEGDADASYDGKLTDMADLEAEYGKLALSADASNKARRQEIEKAYTALADEANKLRLEYFADVRIKAAEAYKKLTDGASFDETLLSYTDDGAYTMFEPIAKKGRLMALSGEDGWDEALHAAVAELSDGAYSEIIETDGALYIVQRVGLEAPDTLTYEEAKDAVNALADAEAREKKWTEQQAEWMADDSVITYHEDVYRSVGK